MNLRRQGPRPKLWAGVCVEATFAQRVAPAEYFSASIHGDSHLLVVVPQFNAEHRIMLKNQPWKCFKLKHVCHTCLISMPAVDSL